MSADIQVNAERLWGSLMEMAKIGATPKGGVKRPTLTEPERQGCDQYVSWCKAAGLAVGVVTCVLGHHWFEVSVRGMDAHAGPTPMHPRRDALYGASFLIQEVNRLAKGTEHSRGTVGMIVNRPNLRNVVPGETVFSVDFRDTDVSGLRPLAWKASLRL